MQQTDTIIPAHPGKPQPLAVDEKTAAGMLSLSVPTLYRLRAKGELKSFKAGSKTLYRVEDLKAFIDRKVEAVS